MTPTQFRDALASLRWSRRALAEALGCDDRLIRRWAAGGADIPAEVAVWLGELAGLHVARAPPTAWRTRRLPARG